MTVIYITNPSTFKDKEMARKKKLRTIISVQCSKERSQTSQRSYNYVVPMGFWKKMAVKLLSPFMMLGHCKLALEKVKVAPGCVGWSPILLLKRQLRQGQEEGLLLPFFLFLFHLLLLFFFFF